VHVATANVVDVVSALDGVHPPAVAQIKVAALENTVCLTNTSLRRSIEYL
jgi:hypothetical protein